MIFCRKLGFYWKSTWCDADIWLYHLFFLSLTLHPLQLIWFCPSLQDIWFRVLLFLVVAPLILLHSSCWLLILRLYRCSNLCRNDGNIWNSQILLFLISTCRAIRVTSKPTSSPPEPRPSTMYTPGETSCPILEINHRPPPTAESQNRENHINSDLFGLFLSPCSFVPTKCLWPPYYGSCSSWFLGPELPGSHDNLEQNVFTKSLYHVFWHLCLYFRLYLYFCPEPHAWDQPLPIWAIAPPQNAWDPTYLQQLDPRYSRFLRET